MPCATQSHFCTVSGLLCLVNARLPGSVRILRTKGSILDMTAPTTSSAGISSNSTPPSRAGMKLFTQHAADDVTPSRHVQGSPAAPSSSYERQHARLFRVSQTEAADWLRAWGSKSPVGAVQLDLRRRVAVARVVEGVVPHGLEQRDALAHQLLRPRAARAVFGILSDNRCTIVVSCNESDSQQTTRKQVTRCR